MLVFISSSASLTGQFAAALGRRLKPKDRLLLCGFLGSGKTTFVQGLADGMGISEPVTSPTFTLVHEYLSGGIKLIHVDPYRLENQEQIVELGFDEWLEQDAVLVVEWAERLEALTPDEYLLVSLDITGEEERRISLKPKGDRWVNLVAGLEGEEC